MSSYGLTELAAQLGPGRDHAGTGGQFGSQRYSEARSRKKSDKCKLSARDETVREG